MTLTQEIREQAARLGFDLAGITTPDPPPHGPSYASWLALGRNGSMSYLAEARARELRLDPRRVLPGCRSILVLAVRYASPGRDGASPGMDGASPADPGASGDDPRGRVAAYAWGTDYHRVLPERMKALVAFIEERAGHPVASRGYTDTGPVLERDLAQRAGLGWIGRNTCLINPRLGSYLFLAELFLDLELEPDAPFAADRCGSCRRCIEACPTQCILPDRTLDARACLSYLTIELKGPIPEELRPALGDHLFGCDICQQVCPWNRFADGPVDPAFRARLGVPAPALVAELELTPEAFNRKFKDSPVQRARRRGYRRNAAVALGNAGEASAAAALERAADDPDPGVRECAAWALKKVRSGE